MSESVIDFYGPFKRALLKMEASVVKELGSNIPPPNAPATIRRKGSSKTLIDTGVMMRQVSTKISGSGPNLLGEVGFFDEENAQKAVWNEYGTRFIPARPFLRPGVDKAYEKALNEMLDEITKQIVEGMK